jgi:hypothetical protein
MSAYERYVDRYRKAMKALDARTTERYPNGSEVTVTLSTVVIKGVVHAQVALCPDRIAVLLENGNVWDYPVEKVLPASVRLATKEENRAVASCCHGQPLGHCDKFQAEAFSRQNAKDQQATAAYMLKQGKAWADRH